MFILSAHCDTHPDVSGRTLMFTSDGQRVCQCLEDYDHPIHTIEAVEPKIRLRNCERRIGDAVRISDKFARDSRASSHKEQNHRQHSRRHQRRAPKAALLLEMVA